MVSLRSRPDVCEVGWGVAVREGTGGDGQGTGMEARTVPRYFIPEMSIKICRLRVPVPGDRHQTAPVDPDLRVQSAQRRGEMFCTVLGSGTGRVRRSAIWQKSANGVIVVIKHMVTTFVEENLRFRFAAKPAICGMEVVNKTKGSAKQQDRGHLECAAQMIRIRGAVLAGLKTNEGRETGVIRCAE